MNQARFEAAVRRYWEVRADQQKRQAESDKADSSGRGAVTGGGHLNALTELIAEVFTDAGFPTESIRYGSRLELPGYFRAEKKWDLVVVHQGSLAAAIELKSQVGPSFGNNFNNRTEEAIGNATDIWTAYREGRFGTTRPWLGYLFLLEEAPASTRAVGVSQPMFPVEAIFVDASYKKRYEIFCRRLVLERLYDAACFATSSADPGTSISEPANDLTFANFVAAIRGRAAALLQIEGQP